MGENQFERPEPQGGTTLASLGREGWKASGDMQG